MNKRIFALLLCLLLMVSVSLPVYAADEPEQDPITISTASQLLEFAEQCRMDTYSRGLTVVLADDIDLTDIAFSAIPVFAGSFDGNGHSITGLSLNGEGSVQGLFRYLTETAVVQNLTVDVQVTPVGSRSSVGGIAGSNAGTIVGCRVTGVISGNSSVGGVTGSNGVTGIIENCTVYAAVSGLHFVGGVAGSNEGVVRDCRNLGAVNTSSVDNTVELSDITLETLTNSDSAAASTDIGGIAGRSSGVIRSCENHGAVGYRQMGYNVGGIAGTQSGYLAECVNHGEVSGRKEVGGIVGQMEPMSKIEYSRDTLQILEGQLNTLSGLTNRASGNVESGAGSLMDGVEDLREQTATAKEAVGVLLPGGGDDLDAVIAAQNALTESLSSMPDTMNQITSSAKDTSATLTRDLQAIAEQINSMSATISGASQNVGATFADVSDSDTDDELSGKVQGCVNYGSVSGDRNIGGVTGAIAQENDLDPEDDWQVSGDGSMNVATELRAVLLDSENRGAVSVNKQNGGGVVGWQYMGLVKGCLNAGDVLGSSADYVGGVAGYSSGYLRENSAKCSISGDSYVGGIAGTAEIVSDCRSVVMLSCSGECVGSVIGQAAVDMMDTEEITENYYMAIGNDFGAVDGISYAEKAEPKEPEAFLSLAEIPDPLRTVTVTFVYENGRTKKLTLTVGEALTEDMIPEVPEKEGFAGYWKGLSEADTAQVLFDMEFVLSYDSENTVVASDVTRGDGKPVLLAQGNFTEAVTVHAEKSEDEAPAKLYQVVREAWSVSIPQGEQVTALRYSIPEQCDPERIEILIRDESGTWRTEEHHISASYAVFPFTEGDTDFAVLTHPDPLPALAVLAVGAVMLIWQSRDRFKRKK